MSTDKKVKCWAHRGYRGTPNLPENTLPAFEEAIRQGAEGLESDVHISSDDVVLLLHDPSLDRVTNGKGLARDHPFYGYINTLRTRDAPHLPVPTFEQLIDFLMLPENQHVIFNIDCKPMNDPNLLFSLMHDIVSRKDGWQTILAPRLILGLWHPSFIAPAQQFMPYATLTHLGGCPTIARRYFWECAGFSMYYSALRTFEGQAFLKAAKEAGKLVIVWTANEDYQFADAKKWDIDVVITDKTYNFIQAREVATKVYQSWAWWLILELYHQIEAYKDARWQRSMISTVFAQQANPNAPRKTIIV